MPKKLPEIGDRVRVIGGMAGSAHRRYRVTKITTRYNERTGAPYFVVFVGDQGFKFPSGSPYQDPWGYRAEFLPEYDNNDDELEKREKEERLIRAKAKTEWIEKKERKELERLKAKYESES